MKALLQEGRTFKFNEGGGKTQRMHGQDAEKRVLKFIKGDERCEKVTLNTYVIWNHFGVSSM